MADPEELKCEHCGETVQLPEASLGLRRPVDALLQFLYPQKWFECPSCKKEVGRGRAVVSAMHSRVKDQIVPGAVIVSLMIGAMVYFELFG